MKPYTEIIKGLREDDDLSQSNIADVIGTTQQQYSKYETGESELPLRALIMLADYYGVSTDFLTGRTECREGVTGQNKKISADSTVGAVITDILSLDEAGRAAVVEYIFLQKLKAAYTKKKDGARR